MRWTYEWLDFFFVWIPKEIVGNTIDSKSIFGLGSGGILIFIAVEYNPNGHQLAHSIFFSICDVSSTFIYFVKISFNHLLVHYLACLQMMLFIYLKKN